MSTQKVICRNIVAFGIVIRNGIKAQKSEYLFMLLQPFCTQYYALKRVFIISKSLLKKTFTVYLQTTMKVLKKNNKIFHFKTFVAVPASVVEKTCFVKRFNYVS